MKSYNGLVLGHIRQRLLKQCEDLVSVNCANFECLRIEANRIDDACDVIKNAIYNRLK